MAATGRVLELLALLTARSSWQAAELADRLEVTPRTLRRDIERLRYLGYPVRTTAGPRGGDQLGAGGRLGPLWLDDEEAVAVAVALHNATVQVAGRTGMAEAAVMALTKLHQVLPAGLRERVAAVAESTVHVGRRPIPAVPSDRLLALAICCRRGERLRFDYTDAQDRPTARHVEPYRLVCTEFQWYLVAFDLERSDWRTFRIDRTDRLRPTGARFTPRPDPPDAGAQVAAGISFYGWPVRATVRLHLRFDDAQRRVAPADGIVEPDDTESTSLLRIGGEPEWIAQYLAGLDCRFEVLAPDEVRMALRAHLERLLADC